MTVVALLAMGIIFVAIAALLTATEAALNFFPRHDAETVAAHSRGTALSKILAQPVAHMNALRFWRVWFEMAAAVAVAVLLVLVVDNVWLAGLLATVVMVGISFVLVGVSPRHLGRVHSAALVGRTAGLVHLLYRILGPIPGWLAAFGGAMGQEGTGGEDAFVSEGEFREFVDRASDSEVIEDSEAELIQSVFELSDTLVRAVMVPRTDIMSIEQGSSLDDAMDVFLLSGYSRIPVIGEDTDHILGILYLKDVVATLHRMADDELPPAVEAIARNVRYVPESKPVDELLRELQVESTHVAIVIDEYGGTAGLVTLEDLIEEIVGEIVDEYDAVSADVQGLGNGQYRVRARLAVDELGELFGLDLEDDEVDTVGGLLAKHLGRIPALGSEVTVAGIRLRADRMESQRNRVSHIVASSAAAPEGKIGSGTETSSAADASSTNNSQFTHQQHRSKHE